ncbi:MAG: DUF1116 domain-containing protein [Actinomycetaceae bacterium]|nr:DUF1116 domain-containing protein [Actinomycetaceae bacterium]
MANKLFGKKKMSVVNVGLNAFNDDVEKQNASSAQVKWTPPREYAPEVIEALEKLQRPDVVERIKAANQKVVERIVEAHPVLVGFGKAIDVVPGMTKNTILHAGPPVEWENMCGAMRGAITGAIVFEGLAKDIKEAEEVAASGKIIFSPCHEHNCVGSMAGVTSASMYMHIVKNKTHGNVAYTNLSEQLAKILRMGANDQSVIDRLVWMRDVFGPMLAQAMEKAGEIDLRSMLGQALQMGDEDHNRNIAGTLLLFQALAPYMLETDFTIEQKKEVFQFIESSDYFSGPTWMAVSKCALDAGHGVPDSTIVTTMCRNGTDFGIRVAAFEGFKWFTGPAGVVKGPMMAGYKPEDSGRDIGDSAITETYGIGGFAMAAAPAIVPLVGGTVDEAVNYSKEMMNITTTVNPNLTIPILNFRGICTGIDVVKVIETGILPIINTAIAHKDAGIGMIGTGLVHPPFEAFEKAIVALAEEISA